MVATTETISRQFVIQSTSLDEAQEKVDEEGYDNLLEYEDGWHSSGETLSDIEDSDDDF